MIPASEGPDRARLHSPVSDATDVSDYIVDAQGRIVHIFEGFWELLPEYNAPACPYFDAPRSRGRHPLQANQDRRAGALRLYGNTSSVLRERRARCDIRQLPAIHGAN